VAMYNPLCHSVLQCFAVHCSVLHCVTVCCSVLQCGAVYDIAIYRNILPYTARKTPQCAAVCCSVLQCVAVCCSVLQCVAVCCSSAVQPVTLLQTASNCHTLRTQRERHVHFAEGKILPHIATHCCNTPQHTATHCNTLQHSATLRARYCHILQHTATRCCNTLQHTAATHSCNTLLQHTAATHFAEGKILPHIETHCLKLQLTASHCSTAKRHVLQHTTPHCNTLPHTAAPPNTTATYCNTLPRTATYFLTLQHCEMTCTATHCHTLQSIAPKLQQAATHCHTLQHTPPHCSTAKRLVHLTAWRKCIGRLKLQVSFRKGATYYRALLRKMSDSFKAFYATSLPSTEGLLKMSACC